MKTILSLLLCLSLSMMVFGQSPALDEKVTPPEYTGIQNASSLTFEQYLLSNVQYPDRAAECCIEGTQVVQFVVTSTGELTDFECVNSVCCDIDDEVIRVLKGTSGMWKPATTKDGEPVAMPQELAIAFCVSTNGGENIEDYFTHRATALYTKGNKTLFEKQNPEKALKYYAKARKFLPYDQALLFASGTAKYKLNDLAGAEEDWGRMKELTTNGKIENNMELTAEDFKNLKGYRDLIGIYADDKQ